MNKPSVKTIVSYVVTTLFCFGLTFMVLLIRDYFSQTELSQKFRFLSDGFIVTGATVLCAAALGFLSKEGAFDGVGYVLKSALRFFIPLVGNQKPENYKEYRERKHAEMKKMTTTVCFLVCGGTFFLVGLIFYGLFYLVI